MKANKLLNAIAAARTFMYGAAKLLGDVNAVLRGKILQRIARRFAGAQLGKLLNSIFRK